MLMLYSPTTTGNSWGRFPPANSYRPSLASGLGKLQCFAVLGLFCLLHWAVFHAHSGSSCFPLQQKQSLLLFHVPKGILHPYVSDPPNHNYH